MKTKTRLRLLLLMLLTLTRPCYAANSITHNGIVYDIETQKVQETITVDGKEKTVTVEIPVSLTVSRHNKDNTNLTNVVLPETIEYTTQVQVGENKETRTYVLPVTKIDSSAFHNCTSLTSLYIPNTVTYIGDHVWCQTRLKTLVIPASVTYIGGGFMHIIEIKEEDKTTTLHTDCDVYLLGTIPPTLNTSTEEHLGQNNKYYVQDEKTYNAYKSAKNWSQLDSAVSKTGNKYIYALPKDKIQTLPDHWATAVFPMDKTQADLEAAFGEGSKAVVLSDAELTTKNGKKTYILYFRTVQGVVKDQPYLFKAGTAGNYYFGDIGTYNTSQTKKVDIRNATGETASMVSTYEKYTLAKNELYLGYNNDKYYFYHADGTDKDFVNPYHCYWKLEKDGQPMEAKIGFSIVEDGTVTAIYDIPAPTSDKADTGVYNLSGQKMNVSERQLPKGIYIKNGKKIIIK